MVCVTGVFRANAGPATNDIRDSASEVSLSSPASNNSVSRNTNGTNVFVSSTTNDAREAFLKHVVEDTERKLENTNLDVRLRPRIEAELRQHRMELTNYQQQQKERVEENRNFQDALRANPRTAWTNMPDPMEHTLKADISRYEAELSDPALPQNVREADERSLAVSKQQLGEHTTNAQLWANLMLAQQNNDRAQVDEAKKQLASFLAKRLGDVQGKKYPTNLSYDAVVALYGQASGGGSMVDRRKHVLFALILAALLPLTIFSYRALRQRKN